MRHRTTSFRARSTVSVLAATAAACFGSSATGQPHWAPLQDGIGLGSGGWGGGGGVRALAQYHDPAAPRVLVAGPFASPGWGLAAWDGAGWRDFGDGVPLPPCFDCAHVIDGLGVFDDGDGLHAYIIGSFGWPPDANAVLRSDSGPWEPLPQDLPHRSSLFGSSAAAALVHDDGDGRSLFVAGAISGAGPAPLRGIARWDGETWRPLGAGLLRSSTDAGAGAALAVFNDGAGEALYVGGRFDIAGSASANNIARWDGAAWASLAAGVNGPVFALAVFDDGAGPALYAAGEFTAAGSAPATNIARWDGAEWSPVGAGLDGKVRALAAFDDGTGPALYAGGEFTSTGGEPARYIARWDGARWSDVGGSANGAVSSLLPVEAPPLGPALYVGGDFSITGGIVTNSIARWVADRCRADLDGDGELTFFDFLEFQDLFAAGDLRADFDGSGGLDFFDFLTFQDEFAAGCP